MVTLLYCCCLLSSAWALVSLHGSGASPVLLPALNVCHWPGRGWLCSRLTSRSAELLGRRGECLHSC